MPRMLAGAAGFEPATLGFGDRCSSQTELRSCVSHAMTCWTFMLAPSSGDGGLINSNTPRIHGSNAFVSSKCLFCVHSPYTSAKIRKKSRCSAIGGGQPAGGAPIRRAKVACKPSSVFRVERTTTIYLGLSLPTGSSGQPGDGPGRTLSPY